ncbi:cell division protein FtsK [Roseivivax halodurans JCM 10272]|uniref:DNA translocase FtsK n=1 Tax=Roseivivax halodurans JCM 10272 TaxID=1449350 RepID=X7EH57_9RHOB|nr:DNA translocase FtsK [Roseivivax halodurans]ETX15394.1 cell division protein FtsK [Roseivivax halodurans JCM 10272]
MAYQARGRDPLFDTDMANALERRGKELLGLALVVVGLMLAAMIGTYTPEDPSWMSSTDAPVQNALGRIGAAIAAPLFMIFGAGNWVLPAVLIAWGVRFVAHKGEERAISRLIFSPIWWALAAVYAAGINAGPDWTHSFGLGGLFGDVAMGTALNILPFSAGLSLKVATLLAGLGVLALGAFVLGFTRAELQSGARFALLGLVMTYVAIMKVAGRGATGAVRRAQTMQAAHSERRDRRRSEAAENAAWAETQGLAAAPRVRRSHVVEDEEPLVEDDDGPQAPRGGLFARMPSLLRKPEPDRDDALLDEYDLGDDAPEGQGDDRVRAKISDAIRARLHQTPEVRAPLTKGRGRRPAPLIADTGPRGGRAEPPLTARDAAESRREPPLTASRGASARYAPQAEPAREQGIYVEAPDDEDAETWSVPDPAEMRTAAPLRKVGAPKPAAPAIPETLDDDDPSIFGDWDDETAQIETERPASQPRKVVQPQAPKPVMRSKRAQAEAEPRMEFDGGEDTDAFELPPLSLLMSPDRIQRHHLSDEALEENARMLENVLDDYGVKGEIVSVRPGPVVTMYELEPAPGLKASRVIGLSDDIARSMSALSARVSTVPGRSVIGIELPNDNREMVSFREILSSREYGDGNAKLPLALGKDIGGDPIVTNLAKMPHLLIAGTTGSGKSVAINTMILSLLYKLSPDELRLVMIDPKMLELSVYDGIPHLLSPVVTDPKKAVVALKWVVGEMEDRYRKMSKMGVRNIDGYNARVEDALGKGEMFSRTVQTGFDDETGDPVFETEEIEPKRMPYIVVIVDEMADLMMVAGKEIEACIQRLAQMARASGIHLIMATQRPSVDVITGTIKANFPTRISFQVTSKIDSRTILGEQGAEQLLGMGDMLYMAGGAKITRCHGPFCSDEEVEEVVNHLKAFGPPDYVGGVVEGPEDEKAGDIDAVLGLNTGGNTGGEDALYDQAVAIVIKDRKCSTSYIQRKLGIGYNKAARLVEQMEDENVVSAANHVGKREILVPEQQ